MKSLIKALCLVLAGVPVLAVALDPGRLPSQYVHDHYHRGDGLPTGAVWAVMQSRDGYLWLGAQNGLVRFDGVDFEVFTRGDTPEMENHDVRALMQADNGDIWIGTYGGGAIRYSDGAIRSGLTVADGLAHSIVYDIYQDDSGTIWFGTGGGVTRLDPDGEDTSLT
ncbi:MAG: ligand-binding sensor domain-containing protein, partial [Wenzhouxiangella sp.]